MCLGGGKTTPWHTVENRCAAPARTLRGHVSLFISGARRAGCDDHVLLIQERYERPHAAAPRSCCDRWPPASTFVSSRLVLFRFCVAHATRHTPNRDYPASVFHPREPRSHGFQLSNDRQLTRIGNTRGNCAAEQSPLRAVRGVS